MPTRRSHLIAAVYQNICYGWTVDVVAGRAIDCARLSSEDQRKRTLLARRGILASNFPRIREVAGAVVFDPSGRLLLQLRDDVPNILYPGKIGLFGGHREGSETFLECVVREIHEELSCYLPPERFEPLVSRVGPDSEVPGGTVLAEFFVVRGVPVDKLSVTEGSLKIVLVEELNQIADVLTPSARFALVDLGLLPEQPNEC